MKKLLIEIFASLIIILFIYAGLSKLMDYKNFSIELERSPYLSFMAGFVAWSIPLLEIIIAILLAFRKTRILGFYSAFTLMMLFTGYIYSMLKYSPSLPCSCGGILASMSWQQHLYFNIIFVIISAAGVLLSYSNKTKSELLTA